MRKNALMPASFRTIKAMEYRKPLTPAASAHQPANFSNETARVCAVARAVPAVWDREGLAMGNRSFRVTRRWRAGLEFGEQPQRAQHPGHIPNIDHTPYFV